MQGPRNHYRGALSQPNSYAPRWRKRGRGAPSPSHYRGLRERCKLAPPVGSGQSPSRKWIYAYLRSEKSHLELNFQYLWAIAGPPKVAGPGKLSPFPSSALDGPGQSERYLGYWWAILLLKISRDENVLVVEHNVWPPDSIDWNTNMINSTEQIRVPAE